MRIGYIYGIFENNKPIYIGSTWNMEKRIGKHKYRYDNKEDNILYKYIKDWDKVEFKILKQDEYCCLDERLMDEREFIDIIGWNNLLNDYCPYMTDEERKSRNKEYKKEQYEQNKDVIREKHKQYRKDNREYLNQYDKNRKNKKERNDDKKIKILCECGIFYTKGHKTRHFKSLYHQEYKNKQFSS